MKQKLLIAGRVLIGAIFVYAAWVKLTNSWLEFVGALNAFQILPENWLEPIAKTLPWGELALGVGLISGLWQKWFSLAASLLLAFFFSVMLRSYLIGLQIDCGCFGPGDALGPKTLARDFSMLAVAVAVTWFSFRTDRANAAVA